MKKIYTVGGNAILSPKNVFGDDIEALPIHIKHQQVLCIKLFNGNPTECQKKAKFMKY